MSARDIFEYDFYEHIVVTIDNGESGLPDGFVLDNSSLLPDNFIIVNDPVVIPDKPVAKKKPKPPRPWSLERLLQETNDMHGPDMFDLSQVRPEHINKGPKSKILVICKLCGYDEWTPMIRNFLVNGKKGCPICTGKLPWTLERYKAAVIKMHGDRYDLSKLTHENFHGGESKIVLICTVCKNDWSVVAGKVINAGTNCTTCMRGITATYENIISRITETYGDKLDLSKVKPEHITNGSHSKISVICTKCGWERNTEVGKLLYAKSGCAKCSGVLPHTFESIIEAIKNIHGDKYDISNIKPEHITEGSQSRVPVRCRQCQYQRTPTARSLIYQRANCPNCSDRIKWTPECYDTLITMIKDMTEDRLDTSAIRPEHINGNKSPLPVTCRLCNYSWSPALTQLISYRSRGRCPDCSNVRRWDYDKLMKAIKETHRDEEYDISLIKPEHINKGSSSLIPVVCRQCNAIRRVYIRYFLSDGVSCPCDGHSKGETEVAKVLTGLCITFEAEAEVSNDCGTCYRYDFEFSYAGKKYFVEFDGKQHFDYVNHFHKGDDDFEEKQSRDVLKTVRALKLDHSLIRIDYTQIDFVSEHIHKALSYDGPDNYVYYSTPEMYRYITDNLPDTPATPI